MSERTSTALSTGLSATGRRLITIRWTLPLCVITPLVSGIFLTSWLAFRSGQEAVEVLVDKISQEAAANIDKQVTNYLTKPTLVSAAVAAEVASENMDLTDVMTLGKDLWQFTQSDLLSQNLYYGNSKGEFVYSSYQDDQGRLDFRNESTNFLRVPYYTDNQGNITERLPDDQYDRTEYNSYDPRKRDWYKDAAKQKEAIWSTIYRAKSNDRLVLTHSTPAFNRSGQLEGVFGIDVYLFELSDFLQGLSVSENGQAFIIETSGKLVAVSNEYESGLAAVDSPDPLVKATANQLLETFGTLDQITSQEHFSFKMNGEKHLAYAYRFQELGIDWIIGVTIPHNDFMGNIHANTRRTLILGLIITGAASLLALAAALNIIKPINKLTQAAQDIKNNRFDPDDLASVVARPDEFSELATLFNDMATVVVSREQSLAEQVKLLKSEIDQQGGRRGIGKASPWENQKQLEALLKRARHARNTYTHHSH